jgi:transcriptional regulator with XRE-family HTH domain
MQHNHKVLGQNVAKIRRQRGWTQEELAAKLQLIGCNITPQIVANIETLHLPATDAQIAFSLKSFAFPSKDLLRKQSFGIWKKIWCQIESE